MTISVTLRLYAWPLFLLLFLGGCSERKSNAGEMPSSGADTARVSESPSPQARADYVDPGAFIPDGYYIIDKVLTPDGRKIGSLELSTVDRVDSAGNISERPILLHPPVGFLTVSEPGSENGSRYSCTVAVIARDSLSVRCSDTPVGNVTINGHFLDDGDYSDKFAETSKVLLAVRVGISKSGQITHDGLHRLTYNTGD